MDRFKVLKQIGNGSYGVVTKAINKSTSEVVAIKKMKKPYPSWNECLNLREVKVLSSLVAFYFFLYFRPHYQSLKKLEHRNIVKLKELFRQGTDLYLVFELCEANLYDKMKQHDYQFTEDRIKNVMYESIFIILSF